MAKIYFFFLFVLGEDDLLPQTASFSYQPESLFSSLLFKEMDGFFYQIMQVPSCWNLWNTRTAVSTQGNSSEIRWFPVLGTHPCLCAVQTFTVYEFIPTQPFCPHDWWPSALSTLQWERQVKSGVMEGVPHGPGSLSTQGPGCWNILSPFWSFHSRLRDLILSPH